MKSKTLAAALAGISAAALLGASFTAFAATPTLFGAATAANTGVTLVSNSGATPAYGGIDFGAPAASSTVSQLGSLMANYTVTAGDCGGGSPRFSISVDTGSGIKNIFAYFGPSPNYTGCGNSATSTGELGPTASTTVDTSQLAGGNFYDTWAHTLSAYGSYPVTDIQLVDDGGWAVSGGMQNVLVPSATVNGTAYNLTTLGTTTATTTASTTIAAPTGLMPTSGSTLTSAQWTSASWNPVSASSTPVTYQYESSMSSATNTDGSFTTPAYQSSWLSTNSISTAGTSPGTYYWNVRAMDNSGNTSPWSATDTVTVNNATSTACAADPVVTALQGLLTQYPSFSSQIDGLITELNNTCGTGTTTPPTSGNGTIDQNGASVSAGGMLDFSGRNFNHEEDVAVTLNGTRVATAHADGGGNFSTGSIPAPTTPGTYTYVFTGTSGDVSSATITVH